VLPPPNTPPFQHPMKPIAVLKARAVAVLENLSNSYYADAVDFAVVVLQYTAMVDDLLTVRQNSVRLRVHLRTLSVLIEALAVTTDDVERRDLISDLLSTVRKMA
jgi:hypothetical protein